MTYCLMRLVQAIRTILGLLNNKPWIVSLAFLLYACLMLKEERYIVALAVTAFALYLML